jgi:hypothetical protein
MLASLLVLCALALLSGCVGFHDSERLVVHPHIEQYAAELPDGVYTPANYAALRDWVLTLIRAGRHEGIVSLTSYNGNRSEDIHMLGGEFRNDPVGDYAVEYMSVRATGRYQWKVTIHYRRSQYEIANILPVSGPAMLEDLMRQALRNADAGLVIETQRFNERDFDVAAMMERLLIGEPELCIPPLPPMVSLFPDTGSRRVIEIRFQYGDDPQRIRQYRASTRYIIQSILDSLDLADREPLEQAAMLAGALRERTALPTASRLSLPPQEEAFLDTSYGALVLQRPTALGLALAYKQLCQAAGLDCRIVTGQLERGAHVWNLVTGDGFGAHVDLFIDLFGEERPLFRLDHEMEEAGYSWESARYPPTPEEWPEAEAADFHAEPNETGG